MILGILAILFGIKLLFDGGKLFISISLILIGITLISLYFKSEKEIKESNTDRSDSILDEIGGAENIDINLSKYSEENQLLVLKNKTICLGYNNYNKKEFIDFDSIIKLEIKVNNATIGSYRETSNNIVKEIIESIDIYIHTLESTHKMIFKLSELSFEEDYYQQKYNEILKELSRFKALIENINDTHEINSSSIKQSIPEQIKEYKELLDIGAITLDEFETKKKSLLNE